MCHVHFLRRVLRCSTQPWNPCSLLVLRSILESRDLQQSIGISVMAAGAVVEGTSSRDGSVRTGGVVVIAEALEPEMAAESMVVA